MILKGARDVNGQKQMVGTMHRACRIPIAHLNDRLTCSLCKGYFIDATTIIECLHSFCRSCIVKYLEVNKYCPVCDVQVHKTKPLLNIRPDKILQDVVYKLVPRLFQNEMQRRRQFYSEHPETKPTSLEQKGEASYQHLLSPEETICLSFNYHGSSATPRYLRCPAAVTVSHLQKLIRAKYDLKDNHRVDVLYNQECLSSYLTLIDIAYIHLWRRKGPMELTYRIYENMVKRVKLDTTDEGQCSVMNNINNNNDWKEVQLRISENGEMSVTGIQDCLDMLDQHLEMQENNEEVKLPPPPPPPVEPDKPKKELPALKLIKPTSEKVCIVSNIKICDPKVSNGNKVSLEMSDMKTVPTMTTAIMSSSLPSMTTSTVASSIAMEKIDAKRKLEEPSEGEPLPKHMKPTIINHSLGLQNLSNNHPLKKHQLNKTLEVKTPTVDTKMKTDTNKINDTKMSEQDIKQPSREVAKISTASAVVSSTFTRPTPSLLNRNFTQNNRPPTPTNAQKWTPSKTSAPGPPCYVPKPAYSPIINVPKVQPSTSAQTKMEQHPQICTTQSSMIKPVSKTKTNSPMVYKTLRDPPKTWNPQISRSNVPKTSDSKAIRPAKFFKMRNNLPRYLGNPASGVKPMYQVHTSPDKDKKPEKTEIKKHSIVKIDPKTLKPVSERAPEITSLSNQSDLKINTSSVPIFPPLKLQCSPKSNERRSPKSPHSPKKSSSPPTKRDKLNLNYTPPNPFIPNLASPTMNPNQFLYPSGPPGFPAYDPRVAMAYHNLFYGQRLPFTPGPMPIMKPFELPPSSSPKNVTRPPSPKITPKPSSPRANSPQTGKTKNSKSEKSLQNALEKLTQNKLKQNEKKLEKKIDEVKPSEVNATTKSESDKNTESDVLMSDSVTKISQSENVMKLESDEKLIDSDVKKTECDVNTIKSEAIEIEGEVIKIESDIVKMENEGKNIETAVVETAESVKTENVIPPEENGKDESVPSGGKVEESKTTNSL